MSRREQSNQRFRPGFLAELAFQIRAFAHQLRNEPDAHTEVAFELGRLATHADALGLKLLAGVAHDAARELEAEGMGLGALRRVATAIRQARGPLRLGPIGIVGATQAEQAAIARARDLSAEPVLLFGDLASFASDLHPERPEAIVLPLSAHDAIAQVVQREGCVVLAHGDLTRVDDVRGALAAGAGGLLEPPLSLGAITRQVRWRGRRRVEPGGVLLVHGEGPGRDRLVESLRRIGAGPVPVDVLAAVDVASTARALSTRRPAVVVLVDRPPGAPTDELVRFVRAHPHAPPWVGVVGDQAPAGAVAIPDADPERVAARLLAWTDPVGEGPVEVDRATGLLTRLGVLDAFDRAHAAGMIDAIFLRLLYAHGLSLRDLFGTPPARTAWGACGTPCSQHPGALPSGATRSIVPTSFASA